MKTRQTLLIGLAGLGFVLAMPTHAGSTPVIESPASIVHEFVLAARDNAEVRHEQRRDIKEDERARSNRSQPNQPMRDAEQSSDPHEYGYGYGYERRQQPHSHRNEGRHRD